MTATRREFLRTGALVAGFTLAFDLPDGVAAQPLPAPFDPNAYIRIGDDGTVTLWVTQLEMGQGVRTLLPMILAEELEADWSRVHIEAASPGPRFTGIRLHTGGSSSTSDSYQRLCLAGAAARAMLAMGQRAVVAADD